jgi:hypothetical protein
MGDELLQNPDFELGDLSGWTIGGGTPVVGAGYKRSGSYGCQCELGAPNVGYGDRIYQEDDDWIDFGETTLVFYFMMASMLIGNDNLQILNLSNVDTDRLLEATIIDTDQIRFSNGQGENHTFTFTHGAWTYVKIVYVDNITPIEITVDATTATINPASYSGGIKKIYIGALYTGGQPAGKAPKEIWFDDCSFTEITPVPTPPLDPIVTINPFKTKIGGVEVGYLKVHYIKNHASPDPDTFEIYVMPSTGELIKYFDVFEAIKNGVTEFYGFVEDIIPLKGEDGLEYKISGRCWKLLTWKKQTERFMESREVGINDEETGFFGRVYPHELFMFLLRCPISTHPSGYLRQKIGWGIPSDNWICSALRTATGHHEQWVTLREIGFSWQQGGIDKTSMTLECDDFDNVQGDWTPHGSPPYLNVLENTDYIEGNVLGDIDKWFSFEDYDADYREGVVSSCIIHLYGKFVDDGGSIATDTVAVRIKVHDGTSESGNYNVPAWDATEVTWTDKSVDVSATIDTIAKLNAMKISIEWYAATDPLKQHPEITYAYAVISASETDYQRNGDWFIINLGAEYDRVMGILIENRQDVTESRYPRHFNIQTSQDGITYTVQRVFAYYGARDVLASWKPVDNVRYIKIRITGDYDIGWEISQIHVWQAETSMYKLMTE